MPRFAYFIIILLLGLPGADTFAQCCASGNPFISDAGKPALERKMLTAAVTYRYSHSARFFLQDAPYHDLKFAQTSDINYAEFHVGYGIVNWLTVMGDLGYFFNKTLTTAGQDPMKGSGIGDAALYLKFNAYTSARYRLSISPSIGVKLPVGVFDQVADHVKLPISVQPSSGSFKYLADVFISKGFSRRMALAGFLSYEYSQLIESDNFYYKYGDQWISALYFHYGPWKRLSLDLQVRNEFRAKSKRENDETVEATGYDVVFFTPQLSYAFKHDWYVSAYADIPTYKYYNGIQMSFGYALAVRVTKKIDFIAWQARRAADRPSKAGTDLKKD